MFPFLVVVFQVFHVYVGRCGWVCILRYAMSCYNCGMVTGMAWHGMVWYAMVWYDVVCRYVRIYVCIYIRMCVYICMYT